MAPRDRERFRLRLGDGEHGPVLRHITPDVWDELAEQEKGCRWVAFLGEGETVWLRLAVRHGRTVANGMLVEASDPLSVDKLRSIPFGRLLELAAHHVDDALRMVVPPEEQEGIPSQPRESSSPRRPGRRGPPPDLQRVADVWRRAFKAAPLAPMKWAANELHYSLAHMRRLVRQAEAAGLVTDEEEQ